MTMPPTVLGGGGSVASDEDADTALRVTALLVVQQHRQAWLDRTLTALTAQHRRPDRLIVVNATDDRALPDRILSDSTLGRLLPGVSVVSVPAGTPFAAIIDTAVDALPGPGEDVVVALRRRHRARPKKVRPRDKHEWLWLLHEDSAPDPGALAALLAVAGPSQRIGIAGCKVTRLDQPDRLVDVGIDLTRSGRHVGARMTDEVDQGQYDARRDVLAVSSSGLLVRRDLYTRLGGFDPAFDGDGDGVDLCWRAHLRGHQVVVVPAAVAHRDVTTGQEHPDRPAPHSAGTLRRHRQVALARSSLITLPLLAIWTGLTASALALFYLLLKRPRRAGVELAQATAPLGVGRILGARMRFRGRSRVGRRHLRRLFVPLTAATGSAVGGIRDTLSRDRREPGEPRVPLPANPGLWTVLLLLAASGVLFRPLLTTAALRGSGPGLTGGALQPFATDAAGVWHLWRDAWVGPGLGHANVPHPGLPVIAGLAWLIQQLPGVAGYASGATAVTWLLLATMPLSGWAAYRAGRAVTTNRWARSAAALAWASLPTVTTAVDQGRLGPAVAHIMLPLALAGVFLIGRRTAGTSVTFGTVLAAALVGAFAPVQLVLLSLVALAIVLIGPGWARLRAGIVLLLPWVLLAPWTRALVEDNWRSLLAGPGQLTSTGAAVPWQLALLHPGGPGSYLVLASAPILAVAVVGVARAGLARAQTGLVLVAVLGLAGAIAAPHVQLARDGSTSWSPWSGTAVDLLGAALLGMALMNARPARARLRRFRPAAAGIATAAALALTGLAVWTAPARALAPAPSMLSGLGQQTVYGSRQARVLVLTQNSRGDVTYDLVGSEPGTPARGLPSGPPTDADPLVRGAVTALLAPAGAGPADVASLLHRLAVHAVELHGDDGQLARSLQAGGVLTRIPQGGATSVWRVAPMPTAASGTVDASRVTLTSGGAPVRELPSQGPHGRAEVAIPAGPGGRAVVLSEAPGWARHAHAALNGHPLRATTVDGLPAFSVGPAGGRLSIVPGTAFSALRVLQLVLLVLVLFLAVPLGGRGSRRGPRTATSREEAA